MNRIWEEGHMEEMGNTESKWVGNSLAIHHSVIKSNGYEKTRDKIKRFTDDGCSSPLVITEGNYLAIEDALRHGGIVSVGFWDNGKHVVGKLMVVNENQTVCFELQAPVRSKASMDCRKDVAGLK